MYKNLWQLFQHKLLHYTALTKKYIGSYKYIFSITILGLVACTYFYQRFNISYYQATGNVRLLNVQRIIPSEKLFFNQVYDSLIVNKTNITIEHTKEPNRLTIRAIGKNQYTAQSNLKNVIKLYKQQALKIKSQKLRMLNNSIMSLKEKLTSLNKSAQLSNQKASNKQGDPSIIKKKKEQEKQLQILDVFTDYVSRPTSSFVLIPESFVAENDTLQALINKFNELELQKQSYMGARGKDGANIVDFNEQIIVLQNQIKHKVNVEKAAIKQQLLPGKHTPPSALQYKLMAAAISSSIASFSASKKAILTSPYNASLTLSVISTSVKPVYSKSPMLYAGAILLGIFISMLAIYLIRSNNNKINNSSDIKAITTIPFAGEINYNLRTEITLIEKAPSIASIISFIDHANSKYQTLWITANMSGGALENLGLKLAQQLISTGKKTILINYDTSTLQELDNEVLYYTKGLHDYLNSDVITINELIVPVLQSHMLYYIGAGINQSKQKEKTLAMLDILEMSPHLSAEKDWLKQDIPDQKFKQLVSYLQKEYTYIIVCGQLPEQYTHPMAGLADTTICLVDYKITSKSAIVHLNELWKANKLNNPVIVANRTAV